MLDAETKLLHCPFCDSDKVGVYKESHTSLYRISCQNEECLYSVLENRFESESDATFWWNNRGAQTDTK